MELGKPKLIFLGGGGHALSCWDVANASRAWDILGYTDYQDLKLPMNYLGQDENILHLATDPDHFFFLGVGHLGQIQIRKKLVSLINQYQGKWARLVSPTAYVSEHAEIGEGCIIHHQAMINAGVRIGSHGIINSGALVEHGSQVGQQVHISTRAVVNGDCQIGDESFIGSGSVLFQQVTIPYQTIISGGSVVRKALLKSGTYGGNPLTFFF